MIHMTFTRWDFDVFVVTCRCGWTSAGWHTRYAARKAGDEHLAAANAEDTP